MRAQPEDWQPYLERIKADCAQSGYDWREMALGRFIMLAQIHALEGATSENQAERREQWALHNWALAVICENTTRS